METLLRNILRPDGVRSNVLIKGNRFEDIDARNDAPAVHVIDCEGKAILPSFFNTHTHAAMSLLRGYADDMPLQEWLEDHIWPYEAALTAQDIRRGSRLAVLEMIKSGTTFFNDMYFDIEGTIDVVDKMGIRACIGITMMESHTKAETEAKLDFIRHWVDPTGGRICLAVAPHAIYTVGEDLLRKSAEAASRDNVKLHIHVSETRKEVEDCIRDHGMTPVRYLESLGVLGPNVIAAHCVWLSDEEFGILRRNGVTIAHCPASNMKLGSGRFRYEKALESGVNVTLATDGASSNNALDMREDMRLAAMFAKASGDPTLLPATTVLDWATAGGAKAFGINAGRIENGMLADAIIVDLRNERMQPLHNLISNWVYSAETSAIESVLCNGEFVMQGRRVKDEKDIIDSIKL